jgi:hypothetical protein
MAKCQAFLLANRLGLIEISNEFKNREKPIYFRCGIV